MSTAFLFPGQGSQRVGMGRDFADTWSYSREVFDTADQELGFALSELCWDGPEESLQLTENTQPAILTTSIAVLRALEERQLAPDLVAGHSLGEYSALVAAGTLGLEDAVRLVRRRGQLMQEAVPVGKGAMAAILGPELELVEQIAADAAAATGMVCVVANRNAPGQNVIAGSREAVERAVELAAEQGAKRSVLLPVSAPFHSPLMAPARQGMEPLLAGVELRDARIPVVVNVDAEPTRDAEVLRQALIRQIDSPVLWVESVRRMIQLGADTFVEVGPGGVLRGLQRRIDRSTTCHLVGSPADVDAVAAALQG